MYDIWWMVYFTTLCSFSVDSSWVFFFLCVCQAQQWADVTCSWAPQVTQGPVRTGMAVIFVVFLPATSLGLKIEHISSITNTVSPQEKFLSCAKLLSGANEGRAVTSLHARCHGYPSLNTSSLRKRWGCLWVSCLTCLHGQLDQTISVVWSTDIKAWSLSYRCIFLTHHPNPQECRRVFVCTCASRRVICCTVRRGCLNNVCCLKGCSVFPLDYKMAGSGSCCDNHLLLQKHISVKDHLGLWMSLCLHNLACSVIHSLSCILSRAGSQLSVFFFLSLEISPINSPELKCFTYTLHYVNTNSASVAL